MIRNMLLAGVGALALAATAQAQPMGGRPEDSTLGFVTKAAQSDAFERQEGGLAARRARDPAVRRFAAEMVTAHTQTTQALKLAIRRAHMSPPPPPALSGEQMHMINDLQTARGRDFDKIYITQQIQAHQDALRLMQGYARSGPPGPIRDAAAQTTPIVQHHLDMANDLQGRMGR
jgi:putative membrane protein